MSNALPHRGEIRWATGAKVGDVPQKLDVERDLPITGNDFLLANARVGRASRDRGIWVLRRARYPLRVWPRHCSQFSRLEQARAQAAVTS